MVCIVTFLLYGNFLSLYSFEKKFFASQDAKSFMANFPFFSLIALFLDLSS